MPKRQNYEYISAYLDRKNVLQKYHQTHTYLKVIYF